MKAGGTRRFPRHLEWLADSFVSIRREIKSRGGGWPSHAMDSIDECSNPWSRRSFPGSRLPSAGPGTRTPRHQLRHRPRHGCRSHHDGAAGERQTARRRILFQLRGNGTVRCGPAQCQRDDRHHPHRAAPAEHQRSAHHQRPGLEPRFHQRGHADRNHRPSRWQGGDRRSAHASRHPETVHTANCPPQ